MSTWIAHLRVAEGMLAHLPYLDGAAFAYGSLSPDSGRPNEDWSSFDPPKEVTHFLSPGEDEGRCRDLEFYRKYLGSVTPDDAEKYSYLLGYFFHLVCDNLWSRRVGKPFKIVYGDLFARDRMGTWRKLKKDWYDLDFKYLREHPDSLFWTTFLPAQHVTSYVPFISNDLLCDQMDKKKEFYTATHERRLDRPYPYLSEITMTRHVEDSITALLKINELLSTAAPPDEWVTACRYLSPEELEPYESPLGDVVEV